MNYHIQQTHRTPPRAKEVELRGVKFDGLGVEWVPADEAEYYSIYVGEPGAFLHWDDFMTLDDALVIGQDLADQFGAEFHNRIEV